MNEPCGCGSLKPFKACCYRANHTRFDLRRLMSTYKDTLNKLRATTQIKLVNEYNRGNMAIKGTADSLARKMGATTLQDFQQRHQHVLDYFRGSPGVPPGEILARTIMFQEIAQDNTLPGYDRPLLEVFTRKQLQKAVEPAAEKKARQALSAGFLSAFEVINARQGADPRYTGWLLLKDMFSGNMYEFKDPNFNSKYEQWALVFGRMIAIDGFHTFDIITIGVPSIKRPLINRILLFLHLKQALEHEGATIDALEARHAALFAAFPVLNDPLERAGLFSPELAAFIRANPTVVHTIYQLMTNEEGTATERGGEGQTGTPPADDILQYRLHFGTARVPSQEAFHDALLAVNDRLAPCELDEQEHFMKVELVGTLPLPGSGGCGGGGGGGGGETDTGDAAGYGNDDGHAGEPGLLLPPLASLLDLSLEEFVEKIEGAYDRASEATYFEYRDAGDEGADRHPRQHQARDTITLDAEGCLTIYARDDARVDYLKASCEDALKRLDGAGITWQKTITMKDFMDVAYNARADEEPFARASTSAGIAGDGSGWCWNDVENDYDDGDIDEDGAYDEDDDEYDDFPDDDDMPTFPVELIAKRMRSWADEPKAVLLGKSPRECVGDPRLEAALVMLVKQVEHYDKRVFNDQERPTYWKLLKLKRR
ncbi:MAG: SEC-C domain-containing protein [Candidatus Lokiarchaeota archaeon]|nr:SEC-C domain-containing protein [Candidatus Lokiarchaeota archaeon]